MDIVNKLQETAPAVISKFLNMKALFEEPTVRRPTAEQLQLTEQIYNESRSNPLLQFQPKDVNSVSTTNIYPNSNTNNGITAEKLDYILTSLYKASQEQEQEQTTNITVQMNNDEIETEKEKETYDIGQSRSDDVDADIVSDISVKQLYHQYNQKLNDLDRIKQDYELKLTQITEEKKQIELNRKELESQHINLLVKVTQLCTDYQDRLLEYEKAQYEWELFCQQINKLLNGLNNMICILSSQNTGKSNDISSDYLNKDHIRLKRVLTE
jgi:hypothetical protein